MDHIDLFTVVFTTLAWACYKHLYLKENLNIVCWCYVGI